MARLTLPRLLSDGCVIQRRKSIHIWGWDDAGSEVTASLAGESDIGQELHLYGDFSLALALLAASARRVEREEAWPVAHLLRQLLVGIEVTNFVESLDIGGGIGARRLAD